MKTHFTFVQILVIAFFITGISLQALGQTFTSKDGLEGSWTVNSTWEGNVAPATSNIRADINILGYITSGTFGSTDGSLDYNTGILSIKDTLVINGNLKMGNNTQLNVESGGVLIITGDFSSTNKITVGNGGLIVIGGDMDFGGAQSNYSGSGLYVGGTVTGNNNAISAAAVNDGKLASDYPLINDYLNGSVSTLPIELLFFHSKVVASTVQLNWATAMEDNFDFFTVERAGEDGNFQAVGEIKGKGFSTEEVDYNFTDTYPLAGLNLYRLKATDLDGSVEYHRIISAWVEKSRSEVIVYPNPVVGNEKLFISTNSHNNQEVIIADLFGNMLVKTTVNAGVNEIELPEKLKAGYYLVSVTQADGGKQHIRLLKN